MSKAIPIFVIGIERSGTKWLSNILCNHRDVISAQSEEHRGIIETNMLGHMERKFNLDYEDDYVGMLELWSKSDFFLAAQGDKRLFEALQPRPATCTELFRLLMQEFARKNKKRYWLQKSNPDVGLGVVETFPDARIVAIRRNMLDNLKSNLQNFRNTGQDSSRVRATYSYVVHEKQLKQIAQRSNAIELSYEDLVADTASEVRRICEHIGLDFDPAMLEVKYPKNTSFKLDSDRKLVLRPYDVLVIKACATIFRLLPLPILYAISRLKRLFVSRPTDAFIPGTFSSLRRSRAQQLESDSSAGPIGPANLHAESQQVLNRR